MERTNARIFRANIAALSLVVLFSAVIVRLYSIQYFKHDYYAELAERQNRRTETVEPVTGSITAGGRVLAASFKVRSYYTDPTFVSDKPAFAAKVAEAVGMSAADQRKFLDRITRVRRDGSPVRFVWIERKASEKTSAKLEAIRKETGGIYYKEEYRRFYPAGSMASHIIGFRDIDGKPLEGLEYVLRSYLKGEPGFREYVRDARGNRMTLPGLGRDAVPGANVELTLDPQVQTFAESALDEINELYKPESASVVVLHSPTGAILALANRPTFDLNRPGAAPAANRKNRAVADIFEPGSIFKPFTASAAIDAGVVTPAAIFHCHHGAWHVAGRTIHDAHDGGYGDLTVKEIVQVSSNIGMAQIALALGPDRVRRKIKEFGFGRLTGSRLPGELSGMMTRGQHWSKSTTVSVSFGQEIAATALQIAAGFNTFASGGVLLRPYIVRRITTPDGRVLLENKPEAVRRVISKRTADGMKDILHAVVEIGTGRRARLKDYTVAGKTGTAQIALPDRPGYYEDKYVASFVCFAPVANPVITVLVTVRAPKGAHYGGVVAAPAAREIVRKTLKFWNVRPSGESGGVTRRVPR